MSENKVWFITGTSSGFGRALAEAVLAKGERVVATARKPEVLRDLVEKYPEAVRAVKLDVTNLEDVKKMRFPKRSGNSGELTCWSITRVTLWSARLKRRAMNKSDSSSTRMCSAF